MIIGLSIQGMKQVKDRKDISILENKLDGWVKFVYATSPIWSRFGDMFFAHWAFRAMPVIDFVSHFE